MIKLIQLFDDIEFHKKLKVNCSRFDYEIEFEQLGATVFFNSNSSVFQNNILLIDKYIVNQHADELEMISATNIIVYVFKNEEEILLSKKIDLLSNYFLPYQFTLTQCFNFLKLGFSKLSSSAIDASLHLVHSSFNELDQLLTSLSVGVFWKNYNLQYIGCNQKFADDISLPIEKIIGKRDADLSGNLVASVFFDSDLTILKTGEPLLCIEKEIIFENGLKKWLRVSKFPYRSPKGTIIGIVGVYRWFLHQHRKTMDVFSEHNLLQILLDNIPDPIYFKDTESRFVLVNKAHAMQIGVDSPSEVINKTDFDYYDEIHSNQSLVDDQFIITSGHSVNRTEHIGTKDGTFRWVNTTKLPIIDEKGKIVGTAGLSRDIEQIIKAEHELKSERDILQMIIDNIPSPIYFKNAKSEFTRANVALMNWLGVKNHDEVIGKTDFDFYNKKDAVCFFADEQKILKTGIPLLNKIENTVCGVDNVKWVSTTKIPIRDDDDKPTGIVGISYDITEQILVKQRLEYARQKAEEASRAKSNFLSNMSHEIRTPMNGIIGMAEVLSLTNLDCDQKKIVSVIMRSGNNLLGIINDILDFSKIESGKMDLEYVSMNVETILDEVLDLMNFHAKEKGLKLSIKYDNNIPDSIIGDAFRIKQILINLISNAIKFTEKGEVVLETKLKGSTESKHCIQFKVTDTGIGMEITDVEKIFESFSQADTSTTRKYGGTGLGLAICNRLVKMMGSKLNVHSKKGEGSVFYFDLMLDKIAVNEPNLFNSGR